MESIINSKREALLKECLLSFNPTKDFIQIKDEFTNFLIERNHTNSYRSTLISVFNRFVSFLVKMEGLEIDLTTQIPYQQYFKKRSRHLNEVYDHGSS